MTASGGQGPQAVPGWYPLPGDATTERYWDGSSWTEHHRQTPAAAPFVTPSKGGNGGKVLLGILVAIFLLAGGCILSTVLLVDSTLDTLDQLTADALVDDDLPGSISDPLALGTPHSRSMGGSGSAWTVSVDEVRVQETQDEGDQSSGSLCVAVVGEATLDSLRSTLTASSPTSFPDIDFIDDGGVSRDPSRAACDTSSLRAEGLLWAQDIEVLEGTTIGWFEIFVVPETAFRFISVGGTVYGNE